jgi:endonuclease YncB( thermonuclease family)
MAQYLGMETKRSLQRLRLALTLLCLWSLVYIQAYAQTYQGRVIGVSDGDTLTLLTPEKQPIKVRLAEIDAPEKSQAFGQRSKQSLSDLVFGKQVRVEQQDRDRYGRVVGKVYVGSLDVNAEQVRRGMAWVYRKYAKDRSLFKLEEEARAAKIGLWSNLHAMPPWEYRHGSKSASRSAPSPDEVPGKQAKASGYQCGAKNKCGEMASCQEARFYLTQCALTRLDSDGDGVPCEALCR